jgi:isocitrate/isopropylmalate dehydrogenase
LTSKGGSRRIVRFAFEYARKKEYDQAIQAYWTVTSVTPNQGIQGQL